jgi:uncharacterized damage-inducible protein DinB
MASATTQPRDEITSIREHLSRYRAVTLQTLEYVPDDNLAWKPADNMRSFAEQLLHVARVNEFYILGLTGGGWNMERVIERPAETNSRAFLQSELNSTRDLVDQKIASFNSSALDETVIVPNVPVPWTLRDWLWYLVEHEVHHKAQLALYLRQMGIVPPFFAMVFPKGHRPDIRTA